MWWIFYNHPENCLHPMFDPEGNQLSACSWSDRLSPGVGRSPGWAGSAVVDESGKGNIVASRNAGDTTYAGSSGSGL